MDISRLAVPRSPIADWVDWSDVPIILAIARAGSLSRAAVLLGLSQPTLSRRLDACEEKTGVVLFSRSTRGMIPTPEAQDFLELAEQANHSLLAAHGALTAATQQLTGRVRVTASEWLCQIALPPMIAALSRSHPELHVDLVADAGLHSLPRGDSDIAIRPLRFTNNTVYQTALGTVAFGLYASPNYIAEHGTPDFASQFEGHRVLHFQTGGKVVTADTRWLKSVARRAHVVASCNGRIMLAECARAQQGIVCLPKYLGKRFLDLTWIPTQPAPPARKLWLGTSKSGRRFETVRVVREYLRTRLREIVNELDD